VTRGERRKSEDSRPPVATKRVKKQYSAKEMGDNKARKAGERKVMKEGSVAAAGDVKLVVWAEAHKGIDQKVVDPKVVDKRKKDNECTR